MRVASKQLRITCHRDGTSVVEVAGKRLFDAALVHLRTTRGDVIANDVDCSLFTLPPTVDLRTLDNAELFRLPTVAKKLHRQRGAVEDAARRYRIGKRFGGEKLLNTADIEKLDERMSRK
jgi:hypothetical protein